LQASKRSNLLEALTVEVLQLYVSVEDHV